jgi:hypothetical protein
MSDPAQPPNPLVQRTSFSLPALMSRSTSSRLNFQDERSVPLNLLNEPVQLTSSSLSAWTSRSTSRPPNLPTSQINLCTVPPPPFPLSCPDQRPVQLHVPSQPPRCTSSSTTSLRIDLIYVLCLQSYNLQLPMFWLLACQPPRRPVSSRSTTSTSISQRISAFFPALTYRSTSQLNLRYIS